jgi:hypothetical protein
MQVTDPSSKIDCRQLSIRKVAGEQRKEVVDFAHFRIVSG